MTRTDAIAIIDHAWDVATSLDSFNLADDLWGVYKESAALEGILGREVKDADYLLWDRSFETAVRRLRRGN